MAKKATIFHVLVGLVVFVSFAYLVMKKEGFTSPGTMVQLATSHVPTAEDYYFYKNIYPKIVRRDIIDMTGGDPGVIAPYYPG